MHEQVRVLWATFLGAVVFFALGSVCAGRHVSTCKVYVPSAVQPGMGSLGTGAKVAETDNYDYVLTAAHVIREYGRPAKTAWLKYENGLQVQATVVGYEVPSDIAVLRTRPTDIPFHRLTETQAGERVWMDGGTSGTLSGTRRTTCDPGFGCYATWVDHGDSGGPYRNSQGQVVGILHSGDRYNVRATETQEIYRIVPTPIRNILRVAFGRRPIRAAVPMQAYPCQPTTSLPPRGYQPIIQGQQPPPYDEGDGGEPDPSPGPRGPQGEAGPPGPQGPPGADAEVDYERIVEAVVAKLEPRLQPPSIEDITDRVVANLPPLNFRFNDERGGAVTVPKRLGETVDIEYYQFVLTPEQRRQLIDELRAELDAPTR